MAETVQLGSGSADQPGPEGVRPMKHSAPFIIEKERVRLLFNEPHGHGAISLCHSGSGGVVIFLDDTEMMALAGVLIAAARKLRRG